MNEIISPISMDIFAKAFNECLVEDVKKNGPMDINMVVTGTLNGYLYLCRQHNVPKAEYLIIKNALQEIAEWYTSDVDVETFSKLKRKKLEITNDKIFC